MDTDAGKGLWSSVKEKVDKVAEAVALMEVGDFEFKDGKPKFTMEDGVRKPRVIKAEALEYGGYARQSNNVWDKIFTETGDWRKYFLERLRWHRMRLSGGFKQALAEITDGGDALTQLSGIAWKVLMEQMADPDAAKKMRPETVAKIYIDATKLDAQLRGEADTRRKPPEVNGPSVLNVINLPEGYAKKVQAKSEVIEGQLVSEENA